MITKLKYLKQYYTSIWDGNFIEYYKNPYAVNVNNKSLHYKISTNNYYNNGTETADKNNVRIINGITNIVDNYVINGFAPVNSIPYRKEIDSNFIPIDNLFEPTYISNDYVKAVGVNAVYLNNTIRITTPGDTADINNTLIFNNYFTDNETLKITVPFKVNRADATCYGFSVGLFTETFYGLNIYFTLAMDTAEQGKIYTFINNGAFTTSNSFFSVDVNDEIILEFNRFNNTFYCVVTNVTKGLSGTSNTYTYSLAHPIVTATIASASRLGFQMFGGDVTIQDWTVTTGDRSNPDLLIVADSKATYVAGSDASTFKTLWQQNNPLKNIIRSSGSSQKTADIINKKVTELALYGTPKNVILYIGRNDIEALVSTATICANLQSIIDMFPNSNVFIQLPTPENVGVGGAISQVALTNAIIAAFPADILIPVPTTWNAVTDNGASIHPNASGHLKLYNTQASIIKL